jgi:hypothetical protein
MINKRTLLYTDGWMDGWMDEWAVAEAQTHLYNMEVHVELFFSLSLQPLTHHFLFLLLA